LLVALLLSAALTSAAPAQQKLTDAEIAAKIERARQLVAVDENGCVKYPQNDEIVVCGPDAERERQKIERGPTDENRIRRGEAVSATKAASCIGDYPKCIHRLQKIIGVPFGYVPPPAIPLEEVLRGLPEPDMIVTNGESATPP
jgi:hypothetical protein